MYDDGTPGEIFITMAKEGSTISGLMDTFATAVSFSLQYGVPLKFLVDKFAHVRFEPSGWTGNQQIPYAKSIMDYIFRWLGARFLGPEYAVAEAGDDSDAAATEPDPQQALPFAPVATRRPAVRANAASHHDAQRKLLQVRELRRHERLQLTERRSQWHRARGRKQKPGDTACLPASTAGKRHCSGLEECGFPGCSGGSVEVGGVDLGEIRRSAGSY